MCDDAGMSGRPAHFTQTAEDTFVPTANAQSSWGPDHLNGPALAGLGAKVLDDRYGDEDFLPARLTVDLFRRARNVPTVVSTRLIREGRRVRNSECEITQDGVTVVRATMVQYRRSAVPAGEEWTAPASFSPPAALDDSRLTYMGSDEGEWSDLIADHQNRSRKRFLSLPIDVVKGQRNPPFASAAMTGEHTSLVTNLGSAGVGYINGDLTIGLARLPRGEWIAVEADSHWAADGVSVGTATLFDRDGAFGSGMVTAVGNPEAQIDFTTNPYRPGTH